MSLAERLAAAIAQGQQRTPELLTGDLHGLELEDAPPHTEAAVLIAVTDRTEPGVLLTQRTDTLRHHAGQVAFPGGRIDPDDHDAVAAALREAAEEIGLARNDVRVIGTVDRYRTVTNYDVTPVIGVVPPDLPLSLAEAEVAAVFEVPLAFLLDPAHQRCESREFQGKQRHYYQIDWNGRRIWGATAAMIVNLSRRLQW
jgi:8-oxo-dGTP pyrophosphatase MutT (NUDIX family)